MRKKLISIFAVIISLGAFCPAALANNGHSMGSSMMDMSHHYAHEAPVGVSCCPDDFEAGKLFGSAAFFPSCDLSTPALLGLELPEITAHSPSSRILSWVVRPPPWGGEGRSVRLE